MCGSWVVPPAPELVVDVDAVLAAASKLLTPVRLAKPAVVEADAGIPYEC